mmetsp:Transcript_27042/g.62970  ORF Transcript_27042/g.62970 Transcript_27042/m.62970 type:complete len:475 (+) Transcript_27042:42-1466(+)
MALRFTVALALPAVAYALSTEDDNYTVSVVGIVLAVLVDLLLIVCCIWKVEAGSSASEGAYKPVVPDGQDPVSFATNELQAAFDAKNPRRYAGALELALEVGVAKKDIPLVFALIKQLESFKAPAVQKGPSVVTAQLCFILDYTGSMKEQIAQAEKSCRSIVEAVKAMKFDHMPEATVKLEMAAVGYNDWDDKTASLKRPVVMVYGGGEITKRHDVNIPISEFNLGGQFTEDTDALMKWIKQPLGSGGQVPEELTGALLAATHLPWSAQERIAVVITDAPCHGKAYSSDSHDPFCDKDTGLTCSGTPEVPLLDLEQKKVQVVIMHTGNAGVTKMCQKLRQTSPSLVHEKVSPSQTADRLVNTMNKKLQLKPLTYFLKPFTQQGVTNVAMGHEVETTVSNTTSKLPIGRDGLLWLGKPANTTKVVATRPADSALDYWFESKTEETEISGTFDAETAYMLTMPPKAKAGQGTFAKP